MSYPIDERASLPERASRGTETVTLASSALRARGQVLDQVRELLIRDLKVRRRPQELDPDTPLFGSGLGLDSIDAVELLVCLEAQFQLRLAEGDVFQGAARTINTLVDLIVGAPPLRPSPARGVARERLPGYRGVRHGVAVSRPGHATCVRVDGAGAYDVLDAECSGDLYVGDGQMVQTLLLREDATPLADVYVCRDDDAFLVLAEGTCFRELSTRLEARASTLGLEARVSDLTESHVLWQLDGPYCWELAGEWADTELSNLPYLGFVHTPEGWCLRAGKTGEYGYLLLVRRRSAEAAWSRLTSLGARYDLEDASLDALDLCALENGFFSVRHARPARATAIELQQQWRVSFRKEFTGSAALGRRFEAGITERSVAITSTRRIERGSVVLLERSPIGRVYDAEYSPSLGQWVGSATLDVQWAHPGATYRSNTGAGPLDLEVRSRPLLHNRSLAVDPRVDSYFDVEREHRHGGRP